MAGSVNDRRKTVCAWSTWRPQGCATTILRLRGPFYPACRVAAAKVAMIIHRSCLVWGCGCIDVVADSISRKEARSVEHGDRKGFTPVPRTGFHYYTSASQAVLRV